MNANQISISHDLNSNPCSSKIHQMKQIGVLLNGDMSDLFWQEKPS